MDRALKHAADLSAGKQKPFDSLLYCNIGNPQSLQQKPITFNRQVRRRLHASHTLHTHLNLCSSCTRAGHVLAGVPRAH